MEGKQKQGYNSTILAQEDIEVYLSIVYIYFRFNFDKERYMSLKKYI